MKKGNNTTSIRGDWPVLSLLFVWSVIVLLMQSPDSPLHEPLYREDSSWLFMCGKAWMNGLLPYQDFTDSKGPLIWLVYGLAYLLSPRSYTGVFWITCLCYTLTLYCHYRTSHLLLNDKRCALAVAMIMIFPYLWFWFHTEVRAEDFAALPVSASLYCMMKLLCTQQRDNELLKRLFCMIGACLAALVLIKFNFAAMQASMVVAALWCIVRERISLAKPMLWLASGAGLVVLPFLLWFLITGTMKVFVGEYFINTLQSVAAPDGFSGSYIDELLASLRAPSRLALLIAILYGGWLMTPRLRRCPWAPLLSGLAFYLIATRHSLWEYYYNICTTFVIFVVICAVDIVRRPMKLSVFAWIVAAALVWGWIENRTGSKETVDYPLSRIVKGRCEQQMEIFNHIAEIMSEVEKPRILNLYGFERSYGLQVEALPAGRYWSYQNGMTPEMEQGHRQILTQGLADFVIVEDISRCFKAGIGPHNLREYGYEDCLNWKTLTASGREKNFKLYRKKKSFQ